MTAAPHVLVVTGFVEVHDVDERSFDLKCPGVAVGDCGGYRPCETPDCDADDSAVLHGVQHDRYDDEVGVATGQCYYATDGADGIHDAIEHLERHHFGSMPLAAGEYPVLPTYDGDGAWSLEPVDGSTMATVNNRAGMLCATCTGRERGERS